MLIIAGSNTSVGWMTTNDSMDRHLGGRTLSGIKIIKWRGLLIVSIVVFFFSCFNSNFSYICIIQTWAGLDGLAGCIWPTGHQLIMVVFAMGSLLSVNAWSVLSVFLVYLQNVQLAMQSFQPSRIDDVTKSFFTTTGIHIVPITLKH